MKARWLSSLDDAAWDAFVNGSANGVFLHTRRFLSYHASRFVDRSLVIENDAGTITGLFPAAQAPADNGGIASHPGATYGGLVYSRSATPALVLELLEAVKACYREANYGSIFYSAVPSWIRNVQEETDLYCLWRTGARLARRQLWSVFALDEARRVSAGHRDSLKKARRNELVFQRKDVRSIEEFHTVLAANLAGRHGAVPVHSAEELTELQNRFPDSMELWSCRSRTGELLAGVFLFRFGDACWHTQYIASTARGRQCGAVHFLLEELVVSCREEKVRTFSLGSSTMQDGETLLASLHAFKASLGCAARVQDAYLLPLK